MRADTGSCSLVMRNAGAPRALAGLVVAGLVGRAGAAVFGGGVASLFIAEPNPVASTQCRLSAWSDTVCVTAGWIISQDGDGALARAAPAQPPPSSVDAARSCARAQATWLRSAARRATGGRPRVRLWSAWPAPTPPTAARCSFGRSPSATAPRSTRPAPPPRPAPPRRFPAPEHTLTLRPRLLWRTSSGPSLRPPSPLPDGPCARLRRGAPAQLHRGVQLQRDRPRNQPHHHAACAPGPELHGHLHRSQHGLLHQPDRRHRGHPLPTLHGARLPGAPHAHPPARRATVRRCRQR